MDSNAGSAGLRHEAFISRAKIAENAHSTASAHAFAMQALPSSATELLALRKLDCPLAVRGVNLTDEALAAVEAVDDRPFGQEFPHVRRTQHRNDTLQHHL